MAVAAAGALVALLDQPPALGTATANGPVTVLPTELVVRASTGPVPTR